MAYGMPDNYQNGSYGTQGSYYPPRYGTQQVPNYQMPQSGTAGVFWVEGEAAARAQPFPPNWPLETPFTQWDINENVFYVKALMPNGRPTPLRKAHYSWDNEDIQMMLPPAQSNTAQPAPQYVTKDDLDKMESDIVAKITASMASNRPQPEQTRTNGGVRRE